MWTQLVAPNLDPYIYQPDGNGGVYMVTNWVGWCLAGVQSAYNSGWAGSTALQGWNDVCQIKHGDRPPVGVFVPIWFDGYYDSGHVAFTDGNTVWSTPIHNGYEFVTYGSIDEMIQAYANIGIGLTYLGWSEDIGGTRVVAYVEPPAPQPAPVNVPVAPVPTPLPTPDPVPVVEPVVEPIIEPVVEIPTEVPKMEYRNLTLLDRIIKLIVAILKTILKGRK